MGGEGILRRYIEELAVAHRECVNSVYDTNRRGTELLHHQQPMQEPAPTSLHTAHPVIIQTAER